MTRIRMNLDGIWDFFPDPQQRLSAERLDQAGEPRSIKVPGPWQAQFDDLHQYSGVAWYRKRFRLSPRAAAQSPEHAQIVLHFGAVDYYTTVWLNGRLIGEHEGGYLPFEFTLNPALHWQGENELVVRVVDPGDDVEQFPQYSFTEIPHGKQSWYGPIGGIWQSVYLEARNPVHITRLHITPDVPGEQAQVDLLLSQKPEQPLRVQLTLTDPNRHPREHHYLIPAGETRSQATLLIPNPLLWDTHSPDLYHLQATLLNAEGEKELDSYGSSFGMRQIEASVDGHLVLNGRILYLRGALDQDYYPELIYTPFSDAELDEQFAKAKHMGLNLLRTHIKITDPRYYDAADRAGILIWTELPNWSTLTPAVKHRARQTLTGMVERDWNHPSIIIWTIVNEGWGVDLAVNADHRAWLVETYDFLKQLDPHRLVVGNSACFTNFHVVTDIEDFHNYYAIPDHYEKWRDWVTTFATRPSWTFATAYEGIQQWREYTRDPWKPRARPPAPEVRRTGSEPMVVSEFGNWGLPDLDKLREGYGGQEPWWFETGEEWGEGSVYAHGAEERFHKWHLDKVFPTFRDLARASQHMEFVALKYEIEQMRRHPNIVGYVITEFTDVHWESNGLLDMCRNPKVFYDDIRDVNRADAILPDWSPRIVYYEGERVNVRLALSHFSSADLRHARLEWNLDLYPELRGEFGDLMPDKAQISDIGTVSFLVPPMERGVKAHLELRLYNAIGEVMTQNRQEFYFFPRRLAAPVKARVFAPSGLFEPLRDLGYDVTDKLPGAQLAVVDRMTDELRWYVQNGGRVLWLAETADSQQTYLEALSIVNRQGHRWQGDWASNFNWLRQDRLFREIPTGGTVDFAFADLTPETVITGLGPRNFASDVHAGIFMGWLHYTAALIAERNFGHGQLIACTFRLREQLMTNPVAAIMLHDMLTRLADSLEEERMREMAEGGSALRIAADGVR